jgi:hypothetical protein
MKKILFVLAALVFASPALADVNITAVQVGEPAEGRVQISWDASSETNLVRAFGLNVTLDNDANVVSATGMSTDYWVYPGTIVIAADGTITDAGSIAAEYDDLPSDTLPGPPDGNGVTLECASLYAPVGPGSPNAPATSGILAELVVDKSCTLCISANVSRAGATGVVMENPDEVVTVNYPAVCLDVVVEADECMKTTHPAYADWETWGKPDCWCYAKQCRGDINGALFLGKPVTGADLIIFKAAFNLADGDLAGVTDGICADLNMAPFLGKRVTGADLIIFKQYFNIADASVPECDDTHINFWETP